MALIFTGSDSNGVVVGASFNTYVTRDFSTVSHNGDAFNYSGFDSVEYFLQGDLFATDDGVVATVGSNNTSTVVGHGASINVGGDGIELFCDSLNDVNHRVTNDGSIIGEGGDGVDIRAGSNQITNNGFISSAGFGAFISGLASSIFNDGSIISDSTGAAITGDSAEIFNNGTITAATVGISIVGSNGDLINAGSVVAGLTGLNLNGSGGILNIGTVAADDTGVRTTLAQGETAVFVNSGSITTLGLEGDIF